MARLVGIPAAVAAKLVLDGTISEKGVLAPMNSKINDPLIKELKEKYGMFNRLCPLMIQLILAGIECKENVNSQIQYTLYPMKNSDLLSFQNRFKFNCV